MKITTTHAFQKKVLEHMTFSPYKMQNYTIYKNIQRPDLGYFIKYSREGYYELGIGDYTIAKDFSLHFKHSENLMRFGTVYMGETEFKIENSPVSSFTPSSFFVIEKGLSGIQSWRKGDHFHGIEITIYQKYFDEVISPSFPNIIDLDSFIINYTYHYLPLEIVAIIQKLNSLASESNLNSLYLEAKVLECIAILHNELRNGVNNTFSNQLEYGNLKIGNNRYITLTAMDIHALQKAYDILTVEACNPPTISALSKRVFLNEQKLKAGFSAKYHMSISAYIKSIKMSMAENLLSTTDLSIDEISKLTGYHYSSNFISAFKKYHGKTPLDFKKSNS